MKDEDFENRDNCHYMQIQSFANIAKTFQTDIRFILRILIKLLRILIKFY